MKKKLSKKLIPKGYYCYYHTGRVKVRRRNNVAVETLETINCPYWSVRKGKPKQENGYCAYLKKGDWDINKEFNKRTHFVLERQRDGSYKKIRYKPGTFPFKVSLLWDQCKMCEVNMEVES